MRQCQRNGRGVRFSTATLPGVGQKQISAKLENRAPDPASLLVPGIVEGVRGMRFITAAVASSRNGSGWTKV